MNPQTSFPTISIGNLPPGPVQEFLDRHMAGCPPVEEGDRIAICYGDPRQGNASLVIDAWTTPKNGHHKIFMKEAPEDLWGLGASTAVVVPTPDGERGVCTVFDDRGQNLKLLAHGWAQPRHASMIVDAVLDEIEGEARVIVWDGKKLYSIVPPDAGSMFDVPVWGIVAEQAETTGSLNFLRWVQEGRNVMVGLHVWDLTSALRGKRFSVAYVEKWHGGGYMATPVWVMNSLGLVRHFFGGQQGCQPIRVGEGAWQAHHPILADLLHGGGW